MIKSNGGIHKLVQSFHLKSYLGLRCVGFIRNSPKSKPEKWYTNKTHMLKTDSVKIHFQVILHLFW